MSLHDPDKYITRLKEKFPFTYQVHKDEHPVHLAYALINEDVNTPWNKCLDCGQPYVIGEGHSNNTFCSPECEAETRAYLGLRN